MERTPNKRRSSVDSYPMVRTLIPFIAGIICCNEVDLPMWVWIAAILFSLFSLLVSLLPICGRFLGLSLAVALFSLGGSMVEVRSLLPKVPLGKPISMELEVDDNPVIRKKFRYASAHICWWEVDGRYYRHSQKVNLYVDSLVHYEQGNRIETFARVVPFPEKFGSYGRLLKRRGYAGSVFLSPVEVLRLDSTRRHTLQSRAVERLERLGLKGKDGAVVEAISVGNRRALTTELRDAYARAGASHILAVSGLHIGIVFIFFNLILWWLPLLHHGQIIRAVTVIVPIWIYAAICGFSPSVVRAALMFSALQMGVATSSRYVSLNALAATAFVMLLYRPDYLYDISFQLSFIAVLSILLFGVPMMSLLRTRSRVVNVLLSTVVIGVAASVATMPLVLYTFGRASIVGVLLNPVVILGAYVIVVVSIIWIAMPIAPLAGLFGTLLSSASSALNFVIESVSQWRWAALEASLPLWGVWLVYGVTIVFTIVLWYAESKK